MVLMTTKEIPYRLNPIGMVSSFARRQVASPFFTDCSVPTFESSFALSARPADFPRGEYRMFLNGFLKVWY